MLKHCVVGMDFSRGWESARHVQSMMNALIETLGIEKLTLISVDEPHLWQKKKEGEDASRSVSLRQMAEDYDERFQITIEHQVREGLPASQLLDAVAELDADGLIVANKSHSEARDFFLGNVALNLARMTTIPLIIVPVDGVGRDDAAPVLLATDGSPSAKRASDFFDGIVARGYPGQVVVVDQGNAEGALGEDRSYAEFIAAQHGDEVGFKLLEGDAATQIAEYAYNRQARMVIVGKRGHSSFQELPLGSTSETLCRLSRSPVMVIPEKIVKR